MRRCFNPPAPKSWRAARRLAALLSLLAGALAVAAFAPRAAAAVELRPVPEPVLDRLPAAERRVLAERRRQVEDLVAREADAAELGEAYGRLGSLYLLHDFVEPARAALANARSLLPEEFRWPYYLGVLAQRQGELEVAAAAFGEALTLRPADLAARLRRAEVALDLGQTEEAERHFREAAALDPASAAARVGLGRIAAARGDEAAAREHFEAALELDPEATSIHHLLGLVYRRLGDLDRARDHLARNRHDPVRFPDPLMAGLGGFLASGEIHLKRGNAAMAAGDRTAAIAEYRQAVAAAPEDPLAHYNLGYALAQSGDDEEAIAELERAIALDPRYRNAHYNLGIALTRQGRHAEAAPHFERAAELDPLDHDARLEWALALARTGHPARAVAELSELTAVAAAPPELKVRAHSALGELLERQGELAAAIGEYRQAAQLAPGAAGPRRRLAGALARGRRFEEAAAVFAEAIALEPQDGESRFGRAMALILAGRDAAARSALEGDLDRSGDSLPLSHLLARLLATSSDDAVRDGRRALDLALRVHRAEESPDHAATVAMAYAETGDFEEAVAWQRRVVSAAEAAGDPARIDRARSRLQAYQRGQALRDPWRSPE